MLPSRWIVFSNRGTSSRAGRRCIFATDQCRWALYCWTPLRGFWRNISSPAGNSTKRNFLELENPKTVSEVVAKERQRWHDVDAANREPDIFQRWCAMDGYDKIARLFQKLPFPGGHFERLLRFQSRIFGPAGLEFDRPLLLSLAVMHQSWLTPVPRSPDLCCQKSAVLHHANKGLELYGDGVLRASLVSSLLGEFKCAKIKELSLERNKIENNNVLGVLGTTKFYYAAHTNEKCKVYGAGLTTWHLGQVALVKDIVLSQPIDELLRSNTAWNPSLQDFQKPQTKALLTFSANCVESIIGAFAIEKGVGNAHEFVVSHMIHAVRATEQSDIYLGAFGDHFDPVSRMQEEVLKRYKVLPSWDMIEQEDKFWFKVALRVNKVTIATGEGSSIAAARRSAAEAGLTKWLQKIK